MAWNLTNGVTEIDFEVDAGTTSVPLEQETVVTTSLTGKRFVHRARVAPTAPEHAACIFTATADKDIFITLVAGGEILTLTDDLGAEWRVVGTQVKAVLLDTPARSESPQWRVEVTWIGVT